MYQIYIDFDGVLADCTGAAERLAGKSNLTSKEFWQVANRPLFFQDLPLLENADVLVNTAAEIAAYHNTLFKPVKALTATGHNYIDVGMQKREWAFYNDLFCYNDVVLVEEDTEKAVYAPPGNILIDDTPKVIKAWEEAGGYGILHTDVDSTIKQLRSIVGLIVYS